MNLTSKHAFEETKLKLEARIGGTPTLGMSAGLNCGRKANAGEPIFVTVGCLTPSRHPVGQILELKEV